ncbi:DUF58 domain-containing protein [Bacillus massilioanorexius]|nr:DUF58 domain-containing protein [Bacillus massilioanorexius]
MLILLIVILFVFSMFQGGFVSWFLFYSFLPFVVYAVLLKLYPLKNIEVSRRFNRKEYKMGDSIIVEIKIKFPRFFPLLYVVVEDFMDERLRIQAYDYNRRMIFPLFQKEVNFTYTIPETVRGEHNFKAVSFKTGDLLGLYEKSVSIECHNRILVFPSYQKINYQQLEAFYEQGQLASAVKNHSETSIVSGVRDYTAGDRLSWIHWKATAKKNEIMTKEFEERKSQDVLIVLDQSPSDLFEEMVCLAASLAHSILYKGVGVAFVGTANLNQATFVGRGEQQRVKIFYSLAKIEDVGEKSIEDYLYVGKQNIPANTSYILITSQFNKSVLSSVSVMKGNTKATVFVMEDSSTNQKWDQSVKTEAMMKGIRCRFIQSGKWKSEMGEGLNK